MRVNWERSLSINFIDFKKACDSIHRDLLWSILHLYGVPLKFISIFKSLYCHPNCSIKMNTGHTDLFAIETGVRQGRILSPFLFLMALNFIIKKALVGPDAGITLDGINWLTDLDFADGWRKMDTTSRIQRRTWLEKVGLCIMHISDQAGMPKIKIGGQELEVVERFACLGSVICWDGDWETHFKSHTGKASAVFQQMWNIWSSASISINIKGCWYASIIILMEIYASERCKASANITRKVDVFHQCCLWRIMKIRYFDHVTKE